MLMPKGLTYEQIGIHLLSVSWLLDFVELKGAFYRFPKILIKH